MAAIPTQSFNTIVSNIAAGMQGRLSSFMNFAIGSVLRAIAESYAGVALWLQGIILQVALLTRLATSYGSDADSWVADFGIVTRIPAVAATGLVVFSRYTASAAQPIIPVGSQVTTSDASEVFQVYADSTNSAYSPTAGGTSSAPVAGYIMQSSSSSITVPVVSITPSPNGSGNDPQPGANGNVSANAISIITSAIPGIDTVTNPAAFINGSDQESDPALKARFKLAVASLSRGTVEALEFSILSIQTNLQVQALPNVGPSGSTVLGMTTIYVDDGSGAISNDLVNQCSVAANSYKAAGTSVGVFAATKTTVAVQSTINVLPGYTKANVASSVATAITNYINTTGLGNGVPYFTVGAVALAVPGVASVDGLLVNNAAADLAASPSVTYKTSSVTVN